jgi:hypothetical protein
MRSRIIFGITLILALNVAAKRGHTSFIPWSGLPDLVLKSDIIATGTISIEDGKTILITDRILKGHAPKRLTLIVNTSPYEEGAVPIVENENVLLFLKSINSDSAQLAAGDLGKWPRADWLRKNPNLLNNASPETIADLVNNILRVESRTNLNDRVDILKEWLDSSDSLLNLVALQYVLSSHIWPEGLSPDYKKGITMYNVRKQLSGYAFKLINSNNPGIREESIRLLRYADPESVFPVLINKITDPNKYVREATSSVLFSILHKKELNDDLKYDYNKSPEELLSVQRKWQEWYDNTDFDNSK